MTRQTSADCEGLAGGGCAVRGHPPTEVQLVVELQGFAEVLVLTVHGLFLGSTGPMLHPLVFPEGTEHIARNLLGGGFNVLYPSQC